MAIVRAESEKADSAGLGYGDEHCPGRSEGASPDTAVAAECSGA